MARTVSFSRLTSEQQQAILKKPWLRFDAASAMFLVECNERAQTAYSDAEEPEQEGSQEKDDTDRDNDH
jgi:hypothetical protein